MSKLRIRQPRESTIDRLIRVGVTRDTNNFLWACRHIPGRINIVAEGDSWFAYPRRFLISGPRANIIDHIAHTTARSGKVNLLRLAINGDEAVEMMSGAQKHDMARLLHTAGNDVHLILFSGGGNDVVGKWDMERLLNPYQAGFSAADCINTERFNRKIKQVSLAFEELIDIRNEYAPMAKIVTHTYDWVQPDEKSAKFIAGLVAKGPWIYPYMEDKGIPERLHLPIVKKLLGELKTRLTNLASKPKNKDKFYVVNTQGILRPGHGSDWKDEMHPTSSGFGRITEKYYGQLKMLHPTLPAFRRLARTR